MSLILVEAWLQCDMLCGIAVFPWFWIAIAFPSSMAVEEIYALVERL